MSVEATSERILPGGLLGYLDDFVYQQTGGDHTLILRGWILDRDSRVRSVVVRQEKGTSVSVPYGLSRPDVASEYPHDFACAQSWFWRFDNVATIEFAPGKSRYLRCPGKWTRGPLFLTLLHAER